MSKLFARIAGFFSNKTFIGLDKAGNRYFARKEEIDGILKEKRWVEFKGEQDPTTIPVEWICWLNGQRKKAPTPEEIMELEARRERVRLNVALIKKEEEERKAREGSKKAVSSGKVGGPDLKSFIQQFPSASEDDKVEEALEARTKETQHEKQKPLPESSEPTGSGATYKPGTWQPPT
ncbi:NADH:ubiquinone oxidoreductase, 17.2kDa subunit [Corchorus capsularis]|uniref:NADH dehydrogenase [ubiquinone] 1 alpha subcomplex subunit 12 n=1 Tax=Corchorus capsularis TaxID=210143 RepID=A0A1R3ILN4_COCAP|nr:NADH:ubiquinone oxidoreductase, 17.2kDa subunit [Corchorus capsularis]